MESVIDGAPPALAVDLTVDLGVMQLANPVMPASGCFGPELAALAPLHTLGAVTTKTIFHSQRSGNPAHRLTETSYGMLNSVGIPSVGSSAFVASVLPRYQALGAPVIVSIGGLVTSEYFEVTTELADADVAAFEINVSCPNLEHDGLPIGTSAERVHKVITGVSKITDRPLIIKLSPTVTSIGEIVIAAEEAGADAVTVANSFSGLAVDIATHRSVLGGGIGGYTGPGIKPLALKLVHDAAAATGRLPIIGCGGITTATDVIEFMIAGATAVQIGTATFTRPTAMTDVIDDLAALCQRLGRPRIRDFTRTLDLDPSLCTPAAIGAQS